ncbi:hypothetical protein BH10PSE2_BH10PSE2_18990 [soil metagenome]
MKKSALKVGIDVPWVTSWTEEAILGPRPCPSVGNRLAIVQEENPGFGKPEYSKNHVYRQRLSVLKMLCPMCGEPTTEDDRVTQVARRIPAGLVREGGRAPGLPWQVPDELILIDAGSIAPLHRACSDRSLKYCPHLKETPNVDVMAFSPRWAPMPLMIEVTAPPPPGHALMAQRPRSQSLPAITFIQLCGLTEERDPDWRRNAGRYRGAAAANAEN